MRVPQVNERVKEAPAHALRAMFAGIGQLLLVTDRLRNRATGTGKDEAPAEGAAPAQAAPAESAASAAQADAAATPAATVATEAAPAAAPAPAAAAAEPAAAEPTVSAEPAAPQPVTPVPTGNVRLLSEDEERDQSAAASATPAAASAASAAPTAPAPSEEPATTGAEAPLPNYDELTIASLRARLRNLTVPQLRELIEYEKAHAAREDVISMFERRIAKLES